MLSLSNQCKTVAAHPVTECVVKHKRSSGQRGASIVEILLLTALLMVTVVTVAHFGSKMQAGKYAWLSKAIMGRADIAQGDDQRSDNGADVNGLGSESNADTNRGGKPVLDASGTSSNGGNRNASGGSSDNASGNTSGNASDNQSTTSSSGGSSGNSNGNKGGNTDGGENNVNNTAKIDYAGRSNSTRMAQDGANTYDTPNERGGATHATDDVSNNYPPGTYLIARATDATHEPKQKKGNNDNTKNQDNGNKESGIVDRKADGSGSGSLRAYNNSYANNTNQRRAKKEKSACEADQHEVSSNQRSKVNQDTDSSNDSTGLFGKIWNAIKDLLRAVYDFVRGFWHGMKQQIIDLLQIAINPVETAKSLFELAKAFIENPTETIYAVGTVINTDLSRQIRCGAVDRGSIIGENVIDGIEDRRQALATGAIQLNKDNSITEADIANVLDKVATNYQQRKGSWQ